MPTTTTQLEVPQLDDFYAVTFCHFGGAVVGFVGKCLGNRPSGVLFEDVRTGRDVLVPEPLSCVAVDGPWLSARELAGHRQPRTLRSVVSS